VQCNEKPDEKLKNKVEEPGEILLSGRFEELKQM
jgi:hypothetical protein